MEVIIMINEEESKRIEEKVEFTASETMEQLLKDNNMMLNTIGEQQKKLDSFKNDMEEQKELLDETTKSLNDLYGFVDKLRYVLQMTHCILMDKDQMTPYEFHSLEAHLKRIKEELK